MKNLLAFLILLTVSTFSQYLSDLNATKVDPLYTTYAAPLSRAEFIVDQGFQFIWYDQERGIEYQTDQAGNMGIAFKCNGVLHQKLQQYYKQPTITANYSDLVKYYYYPFQNIRVDVLFQVYNSRIAIQDLKITNEGISDAAFSVYPYINHTNGKYSDVNLTNENDGFTFHHRETPDGWMKEHNIPFQEDLLNVFIINSSIDASGVYNQFDARKKDNDSLFVNDLKLESLSNLASDGIIKVLALQKNYLMKPNESINVKIIKGVVEGNKEANELLTQSRNLMKEDLNKYLLEDEKTYSAIPKIKFDKKDFEMMYWNAFSLIRQCMLPPEGKSSYNYYVFSREPQWGWGHGGQVFHESLVMLAYAFMDPVGAMNSQRVYMERQSDDGYINYRTGPYLDEQITTNGQNTSSAPWFNWQNWEIYKVTKDKKFLKDAYKSGKKFYNYYVSNRDSDKDGLCEWGAHAVLESVRDAFVAVWDEVADPSNFEGVDVNSMLVNEAKALSEMAKELGEDNESKVWLDDANKRADLINKFMWDKETGFYYNIDKKNHSFTFKNQNDLKRKEIIGFLPMWAGIATKEQAVELMKHMKNPAEFWRNYGVPTLAANDSYYNPIGYWNGPIWVPWQYLIFRGLMNFNYTTDAKELVNKVLDNVGWQLKTNHWFWEFYSADDYQAGWNKTYIWTGIISRMLIDLDKMNNK
ncbi:MAG: trehalase family glycosidase [Ignavibacteriales bacterium]|nr:trehalase family glycosidase [Ignavibacteriales bacterium]